MTLHKNRFHICYLLKNYTVSFAKRIWPGIVFAISIFMLCCLFELFSTSKSILDCLVHPSLVITIYFEKASVAFLLASPVFLTRNKWWAISIPIVIAIWILSELIYLQNFGGMLLDSFSIKMVDNMTGFWDSIIPCIHYKYLWFTLPVIFVFLILLKHQKSKSDYKSFLLFVFIAFCLHLSYSVYINAPWEKDKTSRLPITTVLRPITSKQFDTASLQFSTTYSIVHSLGRAIFELFTEKHEKIDVNKLTTELYNRKLLSGKSETNPKTKLIIVLAESLESWAILPEITPSMCDLINSEHIIWAKKVKKQTKRGQSADGQMIINTGLLPIHEGAACFRFPHNSYPSLSELYSSSVAMIPGDLSIWNQGLMCKAYHIKTPIVTSINDNEIMSSYSRIYNRYDYSLILTASSHSPFSAFADSSSISLSEDMPKNMKNYLKSINFMDRSLRSLLLGISQDSVLSNTTIVITGDHTIFGQEQRTTYSDYCQKSKHTEFRIDQDYCPLIIYSPEIPTRKIIEEEIYQMDIFPTILNILGCKNYYWKGLGIDLLDNCERNVSEDEAYQLSEQIFYSDFFSSLK